MHAAAPLLLALTSCLHADAPPHAAPVTTQQMMRHIQVLASDEYEGRKPGTAGETKTLAYIAGQLAAAGLEPAASGRWYQPVPLVKRSASAYRATFRGEGEPVELDRSGIVLIGEQPVERLADAPVWLVGSDRSGQAGGVDLTGAIVLMLLDEQLSQGYEAQAAALWQAGAAAMVTVLGEGTPWPAISGAFRTPREQLQRGDLPRIRGAMARSAAERLIGKAQLAAAAGAGFRAVRLPIRGSIEVSTQVHAYTSYNVIGRLRGTGKTGEHVLYLGHWDHLGVCGPEGAPDRICNGAVDNASGIAMLIEVAAALSRGKRPERDLLFMATTAEEIGLLGAEHFAANPVVPLKSIVAAINIDTVAIAGRGEPVAIIGRGTTGIDPLVDEAARELGRGVDADQDANVMVRRQDGWALARTGVPTVMAGGSFADMEKLKAYLSGPYHGPGDDLSRPIELGGAAEDTDLLIALGRKLADPARYQPKRPSPPAR